MSSRTASSAYRRATAVGVARRPRGRVDDVSSSIASIVAGAGISTPGGSLPATITPRSPSSLTTAIFPSRMPHSASQRPGFSFVHPNPPHTDSVVTPPACPAYERVYSEKLVPDVRAHILRKLITSSRPTNLTPQSSQTASSVKTAEPSG